MKKVSDYIQEHSGKFIVGFWSEKASQFQTNDVRDEFRGEGFRYAHAGDVAGLVREGARTYATREEAEAAAREGYLIED